MNPRPDYGLTSYNGSGKLQGKIAIITGGDSGIGRAVALAFSREGATIVISYLNETEDAQEIQQVIQKEGGECILIVSRFLPLIMIISSSSSSFEFEYSQVI